MDGPFYEDLRAPHIAADVAAVTLASTSKALIPVANIPVLGSNYFSYIGKAMRIKLFGRMTTGATPGNGVFDLFWGTGADANGTSILTSITQALVANGTNGSWMLDLIVRCRALGASGQLIAVGSMAFHSSIVAFSSQPILLPPTAPGAVTVDLTAASVLSPQFKRSGSTAETMQVHEVLYESLN